MAPITGRTRRRNTGGLHALIQGRVDNEIKSLAGKGAAARGVSLARYIEILVAADELAHAKAPSDELELQEIGLQSRATGGGMALIQARVDHKVKVLADRGAAARGVSIPRYIEILVAADELAHAYVVSASEQEQQELDLQGEAV